MQKEKKKEKKKHIQSYQKTLLKYFSSLNCSAKLSTCIIHEAILLYIIFPLKFSTPNMQCKTQRNTVNTKP